MLNRNTIRPLRETLSAPGGPAASLRYDRGSDTLHIKARRPCGGVEEKSFHLFIDQGYFRAHYETKAGPVSFARMFPGNPVHPDIAEMAFTEGEYPDELDAILKACDKAGEYPAHVCITYPSDTV